MSTDEYEISLTDLHVKGKNFIDFRGEKKEWINGNQKEIWLDPGSYQIFLTMKGVVQNCSIKNRVTVKITNGERLRSTTNITGNWEVNKRYPNNCSFVDVKNKLHLECLFEGSSHILELKLKIVKRGPPCSSNKHASKSVPTIIGMCNNGEITKSERLGYQFNLQIDGSSLINHALNMDKNGRLFGNSARDEDQVRLPLILNQNYYISSNSLCCVRRPVDQRFQFDLCLIIEIPCEVMLGIRLFDINDRFISEHFSKSFISQNKDTKYCVLSIPPFLSPTDVFSIQLFLLSNINSGIEVKSFSLFSDYHEEEVIETSTKYSDLKCLNVVGDENNWSIPLRFFENKCQIPYSDKNFINEFALNIIKSQFGLKNYFYPDN